MLSNIQAARALGFASLAIGATEIAATGWLEGKLGIKGRRTLIRSYGAREIASGMLILSKPGLDATVASGLWARVIGDLLDVATLRSLGRSSRRPEGIAAATTIAATAAGIDFLVAAWAQRNLNHARAVSRAARQRVRPVPATPHTGNGAHVERRERGILTV
jgi:hypothetical protein